MKDLKNRTVLLTGAPGGIGPHLASRLHAEGVSLVLSGRNQAELERLATTLPPARFMVADLSREEEVEQLAAAAGPIDILIANAAVPAGRPGDARSGCRGGRARDQGEPPRDRRRASRHSACGNDAGVGRVDGQTAWRHGVPTGGGGAAGREALRSGRGRSQGGNMSESKAGTKTESRAVALPTP